MLKSVIRTALIFYIFLLLVVWCTPVAFIAISKDSILSDLAYAITNSGGKYYVMLIAAVTALIFAYRDKMEKAPAFKFLKQFGILFLLLFFFAFLNEYGIKQFVKITRPSHAYIFKYSAPEISMIEFYQLPVHERQKQLKSLIDSSQFLNAHVDEKVRKHWIEEAGYSFPSGHTFNAFLLATVLSFSIKRSRILHFNKYFFIPIIWATSVGISRIALGAHSALDVSFGAALGVLTAGLLLYFEGSRNFILHRKN